MGQCAHIAMCSGPNEAILEHLRGIDTDSIKIFIPFLTFTVIN
jgi:hypothetical protein